MVDPVRIQVGIRLDKNIPVSYDFLRMIVAEWADGVRLPKGIHVVYIRWINNVRRRLGLAVWKDSRDSDQSLQGARETLRGLLRTVRLEFFAIPQEVSKPVVEVEVIKKREPKKPKGKRKKVSKSVALKISKTLKKKTKVRKPRPDKRKFQRIRKSKGVR